MLESRKSTFLDVGMNFGKKEVQVGLADMFNFRLNLEMSHEMKMHLRDEYPS